MASEPESLTNCRFYEEKYPEIESFVMVNVKQVRGTQSRQGEAYMLTLG